MITIQEQYKSKVVPEMMAEFGYKNKMEVPRLEKIIVNIGVGRREEKEREEIKADLERIAGQKLIPTKAKKAIAGFKTRQGAIVGYKVTLRKGRMYDFLDKFVKIALPRTRDFRGINPKSVDENGNLTIGVKEHIVFPEMVERDVKIIFGFEVTLVCSAKNKKEALEFYKLLGIPFKGQSPVANR